MRQEDQLLSCEFPVWVGDAGGETGSQYMGLPENEQTNPISPGPDDHM